MSRSRNSTSLFSPLRKKPGTLLTIDINVVLPDRPLAIMNRNASAEQGIVAPWAVRISSACVSATRVTPNSNCPKTQPGEKYGPSSSAVAFEFNVEKRRHCVRRISRIYPFFKSGASAGGAFALNPTSTHTIGEADLIVCSSRCDSQPALTKLLL